MTFYNSYKAVFDNLRTVISGVSSIKYVLVGEPFKIKSLPTALLMPARDDISYASAEGRLENRLTIDVMILVKETEPEDWFQSVVSPMGDVVDAVLADPTLSGAVLDIYPVYFAPGEFRFPNKLYYGGLVRFAAVFHYAF